MKNLSRKSAKKGIFFFVSQINQKIHKRHSKKKSSRALAIIPFSPPTTPVRKSEETKTI
jgi:hypothetical protein